MGILKVISDERSYNPIYLCYELRISYTCDDFQAAETVQFQYFEVVFPYVIYIYITQSNLLLMWLQS